LASAHAQAGIADRLGSTLFVAALAHGVVILGITFTAEPLPESPDLPALNVTLLVDGADLERSAEPQDLLADRAQRGAGGTTADASRPTRTLAAGHPFSRLGDPAGAFLEDGAPREPVRSPEQLVTRSPSDLRVDTVPDSTETPAAERTRAATLIAHAAPRSLAAEVDVEAVAPLSERPAEIASPSTSESALAAYLVGWRQRVEQIGTANFPQRLLGASRAHGRPTLEVAIGPNGHLEDIVVRRSSGDNTLDQAALKILRMAAPFEPLPTSITADRAVLRFAYEWDFDSGRSRGAD